MLKRFAVLSFLLVSLASFPPAPAATGTQAADGAGAAWTTTLEQRLQAIDAAFDGELGVSVHDPATGSSVSLRGDEYWYLASGVKVPVAIAVLRAVERGELTLASTVRLEPTDFVDGAGATNMHQPGTALALDYLIEQMLVHSDNTATDVLIRTIGLERVNAVARELLSEDCGQITTLADVRRHAYSGFHQSAFKLTSADLLALKRARGSARVALLAQRLGLKREDLLLQDLGSAFDAYYATNLNAAPLDNYARMLAAIAAGDALGPDGTAYLLDVLARVQTGARRIKAGLPQGVRFAHKTGTQHRRSCDFGIALVGEGAARRHLIIAACSRGSTLARAERAMRAVGAAVADSGALQMTGAGVAAAPTPEQAPAAPPATGGAPRGAAAATAH